MVAGTPPIRAKKARYYEDRRFQERVLPTPALVKPAAGKLDDWNAMPLPVQPQLDAAARQDGTSDDDTTGSERRQQPELTAARPVEKKAPINNEFDLDGADDADDDATRAGRLNQVMQGIARQVSLDPNDGMDL
jgi:type IV secretion system protein VirD4